MVNRFSFEDVKARPVTVVGAGTLGRRIALMFASRGGLVRISDPNEEQADAALEFVEEALPSVIDKRGSGEPGIVEKSPTLEASLKDSWLVVEAVPERLDIKIPLWGKIEAAAPADTVFATNSSSFPSREMAGELKDKTRLCNMHFYMPPVANAIDLMSDSQTDQAIIDSLLEVLPEYGVFPFVARKESVGFIFNRIWAAVKRESLAVVADGVAGPPDVDGMFRINWGVPAGPFQLMDQVGLDVVLDIEKHYVKVYPSLPTAPRDLLQKYVDAGKLGVKTGEGFYTYDSSPSDESDPGAIPTPTSSPD